MGQWYDELRAHAPSLKVLVYEGWTKLKGKCSAYCSPHNLTPQIVPVTEAQIEEERKRLTKAANKSSRPGNSRSTTYDSVTPMETEIIDWSSYCNSFDVVLTTYPTLRSDLHVARASPTRPRRQDVCRSLLLLIVIMVLLVS